ncbi:MAG: aminoglycoside phosphotransferase family protein [Thiohalocapsa sp.]|nr:aminoglycoside phosphotransferase family protein [Thiohalocapsa sp.]
MWPDSDAALAARDPGITSLSLVLDPAALAARLRAELPGCPAGLTLAKRYIRYKPATNCLVAYRAEAGELSVDCYAKAYGSDARNKLRKAARRQAVPGPFGNGRVVLEDAGVIVVFHPNDDKLPGLATLVDNIRSGRPIAAQDGPGGPFSLQTLAYKPERRFVGRVDGEHGPAAVIKAYRPDAYPAALQRARIAATLPMLPRLLGHEDETASIALRWEPGRTLAELLCTSRATPDHAHEAGRLLAALHSAGPDHAGLPARCSDAELAGADALADTLGWLSPDCAGPARALAARLRRALRPAAGDVSANRTLLHGDFYASQVLIGAACVRLIDGDELCSGDPAADLGHFIADLEYMTLVGALTEERAVLAADALLGGYRSGGGSVGERALRAYTALAMVQLLHRPFRECRPSREQDTRRWIARCNAVLDADAAPRAHRPKQTGGGLRDHHKHAPRLASLSPGPAARKSSADPDMGFLEAACNPALATLALGEALRIGSVDVPPRVLSARLLRHKPGRRALVEYRLAPHPRLPTRIIGKARARGLNLRTWRLMQALRHSPPAWEGPYLTDIPPALGIVPRWHMWLQTRVPGETLWRGLLAPAPEELAEGVADALHALHSAPVTPERTHGIDEELEILKRRLRDAASRRPDLAARIARVGDTCIDLADALRERPVATLHRDFYPDQVLVDGKRLYLLDLDLVSRGDPALDVGNFVAHLQEYDLRCCGHVRRSSAAQSAFTSRYRSLSGDPGLQEAAALYTTLTLARHIDISGLIPERAPYTERMLVECEARLGLREHLGIAPAAAALGRRADAGCRR